MGLPQNLEAGKTDPTLRSKIAWHWGGRVEKNQTRRKESPFVSQLQFDAFAEWHGLVFLVLGDGYKCPVSHLGYGQCSALQKNPDALLVGRRLEAAVFDRAR